MRYPPAGQSTGRCPLTAAWAWLDKRAAVFAMLSVLVFGAGYPGLVASQETTENDATTADSVIATSDDAPADEEIERRIRNIYSQIEALENVEVTVREGVISLSGTVSNDVQGQQALDLAARIEGAVTVSDNIERILDLEGNVSPLIDKFEAGVSHFARALPLYLVALGIFFVVALMGNLLARWSKLWQRLCPNPFLGELLAQAIRIVAIVIGLVLALNVVGATAMIGTVLGGAGVVGLAIGFAVRDSLENYISSIMLSLRQPFRANDHIVIGDHEGKVVRLTSRATVLMTLDGNHLRIPNSTVYKGVILNYTRNPERRFEFDLGIDAEDDPLAAITLGVEALGGLPFVLADPEPVSIVKAVGDSNIVITYMAWINQEQSDFGKSRSVAMRTVMAALTLGGFTMPEPIYKVKLESQVTNVADAVASATPKPSASAARSEPVTASSESLDVTPDNHIERKVEDERAASTDADLLDHDRPIE